MLSTELQVIPILSIIDTQFIMNPNFKQRWEDPNPDKPQCFVYVPDGYMKKYIFEIKRAIEDFQDVVEFVYTNDYDTISEFLYVDDYPDVMPFFCIVDKSKKLPIRKIDDEPIKKFEDVIVNSEDLPEDQDFYYAKYKEPIFMQNMEKEIQTFLEKFLEGKLDPYYQSEKMVQYTFVKEICQSNFEQEIIYNRDIKECVIEIFKHDCPSCMFNGKVFNAFSQKLSRHGLLSSLPCFRMSIENKVPYLGSFAYSPIYFYLKKEGDKVTEVAILDVPVKYEQFREKLKEYSGIEGLEKVDLVPRKQVEYHFKLRDLDADFDIDLDLRWDIVFSVKFLNNFDLKL
jgi:hypothetical protein